MSRGESSLASEMIKLLKYRSSDIRNENTLKAWTLGNLLRDLRDRDVDAPAKEFPAAAPSKLTLKISGGAGFPLSGSHVVGDDLFGVGVQIVVIDGAL